jgi:hypothetical protein
MSAGSSNALIRSAPTTSTVPADPLSISASAVASAKQNPAQAELTSEAAARDRSRWVSWVESAGRPAGLPLQVATRIASTAPTSTPASPSARAAAFVARSSRFSSRPSRRT